MSDDHFLERYLPQFTTFESDFVVRTVAVDRILGREVLVTRLEGQVGRRAAVQERFREAARSAVRLSHPNVIALYDVGSIGGMPYVIQEHSHSESLARIMVAVLTIGIIGFLLDRVMAALQSAFTYSATR